MNREEFELTPTTIGELAQTAHPKNEERRARLPSVPFYSVMIIFTLAVFSLAIVPTCIIVFSSANGSVQELSGLILKSVILNLSLQMKEILGSAKASFDMFGQQEIVKTVFQTTSRNYKNQTELFKTALNVLTNSKTPFSLTCVQALNLTGDVPIGGPDTINLIGASFFNGSLFVNFCDADDRTNCHGGIWDPATESYFEIPGYVAGLTPENAKAGFLYRKLLDCGNSGTWQPEALLGNGWLSYAKCAPANANGVQPYTCGGFYYIGGLPTLMATLAPTTNSKIFLTAKDGSLVSSNNLNLSVLSADNTTFIQAVDAPDSLISELSKTLLDGKSSWQDIAAYDLQKNIFNVSDNSPAPTVEYTLSDGKHWITSVLLVTFQTPEEFYLVVSIPRDDFFGHVDSSIASGITLSSVFSSIGIVTAILVTIAIVMPMSKLTSNMQQVSNFDFSMLRTGVLREDSVFTEVRKMQATFNVMVKAFAGAIRINKILSAGSRSESTITQ